MDILGTWEEVGNVFNFSPEMFSEMSQHRLIFACSDEGGWEGDAFVLWEQDGVLMEANESHCSCDGYGWNPEETSLAYYWRWFMKVGSGEAHGHGAKFACFDQIVTAINQYAKETK